MKTPIYWFSATGNSLRVARAIRDGLTDAELIPMARAVAEPVPIAQRLGLVFSVHAWGPPEMVTRFIRKLPPLPDAYVFCVMTYGMTPGSAGGITRHLLRERGIDLSAVYAVRMPTIYPPLGGAPGRKKRERRLADAERAIETTVESLKASPNGRFDKAGVFWRIVGRMIYPLFRGSLPKSDRRFLADEKCNHCAICAKVCPVENIEIVDGLPRWLGHCEQCFACFHWCPQKAIQYGRRTQRQVRYHHPACRAEDLMVRDRDGDA